MSLFGHHPPRITYYASCSPAEPSPEKFLLSTTDTAAVRSRSDRLIVDAIRCAPGKRIATGRESNGCSVACATFLRRIAGRLCRDRQDLGTVSPDEPGCLVENVQDRGRLGRRQQCPGSLLRIETCALKTALQPHRRDRRPDRSNNREPQQHAADNACWGQPVAKQGNRQQRARERFEQRDHRRI
jgi:hypothetical protein